LRCIIIPRVTSLVAFPILSIDLGSTARLRCCSRAPASRPGGDGAWWCMHHRVAYVRDPQMRAFVTPDCGRGPTTMAVPVRLCRAGDQPRVPPAPLLFDVRPPPPPVVCTHSTGNDCFITRASPRDLFLFRSNRRLLIQNVFRCMLAAARATDRSDEQNNNHWPH
jgi:hypothetical protein